VNVQGTLASGLFEWQGIWSPWLPQPWFSAHIHVQNALPFIAQHWLEVSALPYFIQGRISGDLDIKPRQGQWGWYEGEFSLDLVHAKLQSGLVKSPDFETLAGYAPQALFQRLAPKGSLHSHQVFTSLELKHGLNLAVLGEFLLSDWLQRKTSIKPMNKQEKTRMEVFLRLHQRRDWLKQNERVRLRKVLHALQQHPKAYVILHPMLGQSTLDESMMDSIRQTQGRIEDFLVERGVHRSRIVPRLPENSRRSGDMTGIQLQMM